MQPWCKSPERKADAVIKFMNQNKMGDRIKGYQWEFNLVNSPDVNAWCMPGRKVVVYTACCPLRRMRPAWPLSWGHEIAHAVARHGNERMSQMMVAPGDGHGTGCRPFPKAGTNPQHVP